MEQVTVNLLALYSNHRYDNCGAEPKIIIMHPYMYNYIEDVARLDLNYNYNPKIGMISFRGIKIIRSLDLDKASIQIY